MNARENAVDVAEAASFIGPEDECGQLARKELD